MRLQVPAIALASILASGLALSAEKERSTAGDPYAAETKVERDKRMAWWREAKFGMFIHWGVYAVPAGVHNGVRDGEWIMLRAEIPVKEYRDYSKRFTAEHYDPQAWVNLAQKAGMRYMVLTAKHHDGFALYPTAVSDWDVVESSPAGRDLIAPLAEAARAKGMKFGLYYSHSQDWVHPGGAKWRYDEGTGWDGAHKGAYDDYLKTIAVPQVREILTRYQPDVLWWDTPHYMTPERAKPLVELLKLRPGIIHNDRLGGGYQGDTQTPENFIPPAGFPGKDWETCMTMNDNWGYVRDDHDWKSFETIIRQLVAVVSKGGNYLLNVGPDAMGRIPQESIDRLTAVGEWMKVNGEAIYGSHAGPFNRLGWGRCTLKPAGNDDILYLHVWNWKSGQALLLPGLKNPVKSATLLANGSALEGRESKFGPEVILKGAAPDPISSTIKVLVKGRAAARELPVIADMDGVIRLTPLDAKLQGKSLKLGETAGKETISKWDNPDEMVSWDVEVTQTGKYAIQLTAAAAKAGAVIRVVGLGQFACSIPETENLKTFKTTLVGEVSLKQGQKIKLHLEPVADGWQPVNLNAIELVPEL